MTWGEGAVSSSWTLGWIKDIIRCELHEKGLRCRMKNSKIKSGIVRSV